MKKLILISMIGTMIIISGPTLVMAETNVTFKFESNPTDEQIFKTTLAVLNHYHFSVMHEDVEALWIRAVRKITKENVYYLQYYINIKDKQISVLANVTEYDPGAGISGGTASGPTVFGKRVSTKESRFSEKWRSDKELHDARWLLGKVIKLIGTRLDNYELKKQIR